MGKLDEEGYRVETSDCTVWLLVWPRVGGSPGDEAEELGPFGHHS